MRGGRSKYLTVLATISVLGSMFMTPATATATIGYQTYSYKEGFDACSQWMGHTDVLLDVWTGSPWWEWGTYIGGSGGAEVGCVGEPTASITYAASIGWAMAPIWYGPQEDNSCTGYTYSHTFSLNTSTAYSQGYNEGQAASAVASSYGFGANNPIFYDLEKVGGSSACIAAAQAFINGWDVSLDFYSPFWGSLYGSSDSSHLSSFATIANVPYSIEARDYAHDPTGVYGLQALPDGYWVNAQRIHQLAVQGLISLGHSFGIDETCVDARVATNGPAQSYNNCGKY